VGANALLRTAALADIRTEGVERGFPVTRFIQDRTVIEDTESSVDLVCAGWKLENYPERLSFSATPADFGSLLIQRRRWANGGLIILPKLLRYLLRRPFSWAKSCEGFLRMNYLVSIAAVNTAVPLLLLYPFEQDFRGLWLPLTALPYFYLYGRDLVLTGYRWADLVRVYALNLLLIPVNLGGVLKSLQQGFTGQTIPFCRTPKVAGRTATPSLYVLAEYLTLAYLGVCLVVDLERGYLMHALFCLANGAAWAWAVVRLIGWRESWEDAFGRHPGVEGERFLRLTRWRRRLGRLAARFAG
jgi:cellulose synthase/poly-beta-1,6-N-acetylglucosamine synthase-like glycosyltransferase